MINYFKNEIAGKYQLILFSALIFSTILIGIFYIYCVGSIVMETVNRSQGFQNLQVVVREYQELEKNYLSLLSKFNLDYAYSLGFVSENSLNYISLQAPVAQNSRYDKALR
jgi:hypothetical protein